MTGLRGAGGDPASLCREAQALAAAGIDIDEAGAELATLGERDVLVAARECCLDELAVDLRRRVLLIRAVRILNAALRG